MTATLISIISVFIGILGANTMGVLLKKKSFGFIGNTIAGVFGGVFLIKSFGRLGFDPMSIMGAGTVDYTLFTINTIVSFSGGAIAAMIISRLKKN